VSAADALRIYALDEGVDRDGYPVPWAKGEPSIKDLVRELAGHRCVRCGHPYRKGENGKGEWSPCDERCSHGGPVRRCMPGAPFEFYEDAGFLQVEALVQRGHVDAQWRILTVHHLTGSKLDCRWWNLAALCQRCHLTIQGRVRMEQIYPHEHTPWFRPYAAGYYASVYLGEELTRDETLERLDELLALEMGLGRTA
jgi:hypothetical protein